MDTTHANRPWGAIDKFLHWATALAVLAAFVLGPEGHDRGTVQDLGQQWHQLLGLVVAGLSVLRLGWRATHPHPMGAGGGLTDRIAHWTQRAFYLLLLLVPASAVAALWLGGHGIQLPGGLVLSPMVAAAQRLGHVAGEVHETLADVLIALAGLHAAAAIVWHQLVLGDGVLRGMLPGRR